MVCCSVYSCATKGHVPLAIRVRTPNVLVQVGTRGSPWPHRVSILDAFRPSIPHFLSAHLLRDEHVGAFNVAVDDALVVEIPRPQQNLVHEPPDQVFPEYAELLQHARDRAPRDVLEEDVEMSNSAISAAVADDVPGRT